MTAQRLPRAVVLDTNVVLDLLVFHDASTQPLAQALREGALVWHATGSMRAELQRVLGYPALQSWLQRSGEAAPRVLAQFDRCAQVHPEVAAAGPRCDDPDDQKFVDLALALRCLLLSKDGAVLRLQPALAVRGVAVLAQFNPPA